MSDVSPTQGDDPNQSMMEELCSIEQRLQCRLGSRVREVQLRVEPHGLVIIGRSTSYYDKQLAQHIVKELCGLSVAENRIAVDSSESPDSEPLIHWGNRLHRPGAEHGQRATHPHEHSASQSFLDER